MASLLYKHNVTQCAPTVFPTGSSDTDDNNRTVDNRGNSCDLCSRERVVIGKS